MFGLLGDMAKGLRSIVGVAVGSIVGVSSIIVATTLGITTEMVDEARAAGCNTYEEIKDFFDL